MFIIFVPIPQKGETMNLPTGKTMYSPIMETTYQPIGEMIYLILPHFDVQTA
jgi:hypothetical protein